MAMGPLPAGVGGMLFGGGGGAGGGHAADPVAVGGGKNAVSQHMGSPHTGMKNTVTKGDPFNRMMGNYGKSAGLSGISGASPLKQIRGGTGQMRRIRGGLGPGKMGMPGPSDKDYSMKSGDTE